MGFKLKGEIIEEEVSYQSVRSKEIFLRTRTYETIGLSEYFRPYIGDTITIKVKYRTEE